MDRRDFLGATLSATLGATVGAGILSMAASNSLGASQGTPRPAFPAMTVYKSPSCGCCKGWVEHAKGAGFTVKVVDTDDLASVKREMGIPANLQSCHTVVVGSYVLEGHIPAVDVKRLLAEKPKVRGLAVPGMPVGSPGMEQGSPLNYDRYEVLAFTADGKTTVWAKH